MHKINSIFQEFTFSLSVPLEDLLDQVITLSVRAEYIYHGVT